MTVFDAPDREFCIVRRSTTNTPLQALTLLNDPIFVEAARKLAERSIHEGGSSPEPRLAFVFRLATGRAPDERNCAFCEKRSTRCWLRIRRDEKGARALRLGRRITASIARFRSANLLPIPQWRT